MFTTRTTEKSSPEGHLWRSLAAFAKYLSQQFGLCGVNTQYLEELSSLADRYDVKSDLASGFLYSLGLASALGRILADLIYPRVPKKGLIADRDGTLWAGIVGDDGAEDIVWRLEHN